MYGDPAVLRARVHELREQALDVRAMADHLVAQLDDLAWTGRAATTMRARIVERALHLRAAASEHDVAADALAEHAEEVECLQESIDAIERSVAERVADARTRSSASPARLLADADLALLALEAPPAGHRDWLALELPHT